MNEELIMFSHLSPVPIEAQLSQNPMPGLHHLLLDTNHHEHPRSYNTSLKDVVYIDGEYDWLIINELFSTESVTRAGSIAGVTELNSHCMRNAFFVFLTSDRNIFNELNTPDALLGKHPLLPIPFRIFFHDIILSSHFFSIFPRSRQTWTVVTNNDIVLCDLQRILPNCKRDALYIASRADVDINNPEMEIHSYDYYMNMGSFDVFVWNSFPISQIVRDKLYFKRSYWGVENVILHTLLHQPSELFSDPAAKSKSRVTNLCPYGSVYHYHPTTDKRSNRVRIDNRENRDEARSENFVDFCKL